MENCGLNCRVTNNGFIPAGQKVVEYMMEHGGLVHFETMWRRHFVDTMKPQFLPMLWSVDHGHDKLTNFTTAHLSL